MLVSSENARLTNDGAGDAVAERQSLLPTRGDVGDVAPVMRDRGGRSTGTKVLLFMLNGNEDIPAELSPLAFSGVL